MDIHQILAETPSLIARKAEEAENLRAEWKNAINVYEHQESLYVLKLKLQQEVKATEIKYYVNSDGELFSSRKNLVLLEANYRKKDAEIKGLEEELNSAKMQCRHQIAEMSNLGFNAGKQKEAENGMGRRV